ncbi:MAG: FAD-dependent oxidoreductase, partial [Sphingomicrobium sp.]
MIVERVLVVGAGLAGLSAAIALARRGSAVTVVTREEQAEGASITITNRAVDAIEALGVLEACVAEGVTPIGSESIFAAMFDSEGKPLPVAPPPPRPDDRLPPYIAIYRPDLTRILTAAAIEAGVAIRSGVSFSALEDLSETVAVTLSDGTSDRFDLVVGAEGAHSPTRRAIFPALDPHYTGWMSFRIVIEDAPGGPAGFYSLPGGQGMLAIVRLPRGRLYLAAGKRMESRRLDQPEAVSLLDEVLAPYTAPLARAIRARLASDPPTVVARPFDTLLVPSPWHRGRVIIIGDAAHATT